MEEIAIIGVGCKLPGADDIDQFWRVLQNGENHVLEVPSDRWNLDAFYDPDPNAPGKTYVRRAGFIKNHDSWDNKVYGVNDFEASQMDPQQRFVLDCCFKAMENAGVTRKSMDDSNTGVYIGVMNSDYKALQSSNSENMNNYTLTGTSTSIVAARISFTFNLHGPAMSLDTACSSSLLAIHLAAQALREGDCDMALAGGVNSLMTPEIFVQLSKARMASPTGYCQAFSSKADGYARGEGAGILLLKRLKDAERDNDPIWATIMTGSNQDGHSVTPMTAPSGSQQFELLKKVYNRYNIDPDQLEYIEAHGTGTQAGDPVEANCLGGFLTDHTKNAPRYIGSVKTNIGHLESAAGVAGVIKVLLMQKHSTIVPTLHFDTPNEKIDFEKLKLIVATSLDKWPCFTKDGTKLSCVNSFSFGGTNCHAVVKSYTKPKIANLNDSHTDKLRLICFSGTDDKSLKASIEHFKEHAKSHLYSLNDVSFTSTARRDHYPVRIAKVVKSMEDTIEQLDSITDIEKAPIKALQKKKYVIFVFGGMGSTWKGMCTELMKTNHVFYKKILEIDALLLPLTGWSIYQRFEDSFDPTDPYFGPIASFTCQVALDAVWKYWGIKPDCVVGQSVGEVAASHSAGALSLKDAVKVIYHRTYRQANATGGSMLVVSNYAVANVEQIIGEYPGKIVIAVHNSPMSCTLSGDCDIIKAVKSRLEEIRDNLDTPMLLHDLTVTSAFHSHHMTECSIQIKDDLSGLQGSKPGVKLYSTVSAKEATETDFITAEYWANNVREPVLFRQALQDAQKQDCFNIFLEIGSKPVLIAHSKDNFEADHSRVLISMKKQNEAKCMMQNLAKLYMYGIDPNWENVNGEIGNVTDIPQYIFSPKSNLLIPEKAKLSLMGGDMDRDAHPFLRPILGENKSYKVMISPNRIGSVYEHFVMDSIFIPGAFYGEVGLAIAEHMTTGRVAEMAVSITFKQPLVLHPGKSVELDVKTNVEDDFRSEKEKTNYTVVRENQTLAVGCISWSENSEREILDLDEIRDRCHYEFSHEDIYGQLKELGFSYGTPLRVLADAVCNDTECLVHMRLPEEIREERVGTFLHPAILDGMLQTPGVLGGIDKGLGDDNRQGMEILPVQIGNLTIKGSPRDTMVVYGRIIKKTEVTTHYDITLMTEDGDVIAEARNFVTRNLGIASTEKQMMYNIHWRKINTFSSPDSQKKDDCSSLLVLDNSQKHKLKGSNVVNLKQTEPIIHQISNMINQLSSARAIIYLSYQGNSNFEETSTVFNSILDECMQIRELVLYLLEKRIIIPLFIITTEAWIQNYRGDSKKVSADTPSAAALWGMMRTVGRELYDLTIKLVDISDNYENDLDILLSNVVNSICPEDGDTVADAEFIISESTLYSLEFLNEVDGMENKCRNVDMDEKCEVKLYSQTNNDYVNPFMIYAEEPRPTSHSDVLLKVDTLAIQNTSLYSTCIDNVEVLQIPHISSAYPVLCLEASGCLVNSNKKYISCYPTQAGTTVVVPESALISAEYLPVYHPGLMIKIVLMWSLCQSISSREVTILYNSKTKSLMRLMSLILTTRYNKMVQAVSVDDIETIQNETIVSLVNLNQMTIHDVIASWTNAESLSTITSLIDNLSIAVVHDKLPQVTMQIFRTGEMFSPAMLLQIVPKINNWIQAQTDELAFISKSFKAGMFGRRRSSIAIPRSIDIMRLLSVTEIPFSRPSVLPPTRAVSGRLFRRDAAYIVVGGLTGLGWECVKLLAANGAGYVICFNRRTPSEENLMEIQHLQNSSSCHVRAVQVDVTNFQSVRDGFDEVTNSFPGTEIKGVIFGAAVLKDAFIESMDKDKFMTALSPKVKGAWNLHLLTRDLNLDYFIMHSSITGILGNQGQANYGAGNAFEDGLAHFRRSIGLPGQSFNWGPLNLGMLKETESTEKVIKLLKSQGYELLEVEEIHHCLVNCLLDDYPQTMLAKFDLANFSSGNAGNQDLLTKFHAVLPSHSLKLDNLGDDNQRMALDIPLIKTLEKETRLKILEEYMSVIACKVFAVDESMVTPESSVVDLGMDSMLAMTIIDQVNKDTKYRIPMVVLLSEGATISKIANVIEKSFSDAPAEEIIDPPSKKIIDVTDDAAVQKKEITGITSKLEHLQEDKQNNVNNINNLSVNEVKEPAKMKQILETENPLKASVKDISVDNRVTVIEKYIYELNERINTLPFHFIKDIIFKGTGVNLDIIKDCAHLLIDRHPIAQTLFQKIDNSDETYGLKRLVDKQTLDFRVVTDSSNDEEYKKMSAEPFNLGKSGPVRIICSPSPPSSFRVRLICHLIGFDSFALASFISDFQSQVVTKASNKDIPTLTVNNEKGFMKVDDLLRSHLPERERFWLEQIPKSIPKMYFKTDNNHFSNDPMSKITKRKLDHNVSQNLFDFLKHRNTSVLGAFISFYQLLLSFYTENELVVVLTKYDLRSLLSGSSAEVSNLTNDIPVFSRVSSSQTFSDFLTENSKTIENCLQNGAYHYSLIANMASSDECRSNLKRHCVVKEDVKKTVPAKSLGLLYDTLLMVSTNSTSKSLELQLQYRSSLYSDNEAKSILDQLNQIILQVTADSKLSIGDIREELGVFENKGEKKVIPKVNIIEDSATPSHTITKISNSAELPENSLSSHEYYFYEKYLLENPIGHHMITDIYLKKKSGFEEIWRKAAIRLLERYRTLRTVYVKSEPGEIYKFGVKKMLRNPQDILDFQCIKNSNNDAEFERITRQPFDLSRRGCLRIIFAGEPATRIRIVFQHVSIDFFTIGVILKDLREIVLAIAYEVDIPPTPSEQTQRSAILIKDAVKPIEADLKSFWQSKTKVGIPDITLQIKPRNDLKKGDIRPIITKLPIDVSTAILKLAPQLRTTVFKFFASIYQMYFHFMTEKERVVISAPLDLRIHIPEARSLYENMTSIVPLFSELHELDLKVKDFFTSNTVNINQCLSNGLYSLVHIRELLENKEEGKWLNRHSVVEEDMSTVGYLHTSETKELNSDMQPTLGFVYETRLLVWVNKRTSYIRLHLECLPELYSEAEAQGHMDNIVKLMNAVLKDSDQTMLALKDLVVPKQQIIPDTIKDEDDVGARFLKETSLGYDHLVYAKLTKENGRPEIKWASIGFRGRSKPKKFKSLSLTEVTKSYLATYKGFRTLVLESRTKKYIFKFIGVTEVAGFTRRMEQFLEELPVLNGHGNSQTEIF